MEILKDPLVRSQIVTQFSIREVFRYGVLLVPS